MSQVTIVHVWILEALYLATHALVFLEDIHHFWCIKGSENFLSKYFFFILFKIFSSIYLITEVFFFSSPFWEVVFQIILCIYDLRFYSEVYRWKSIANILLSTWIWTINSRDSDLFVWILWLSTGKYLWKYLESLDFAIRIPCPFLDAFIGVQGTESIYLIRLFTYSIRLRAMLVDMKEPLDFTWGLTLKIHTRGPIVLVI